MTDARPHRSLDSLRKEAKRWLAALRRGDVDSRARLERALAKAPPEATLRDVQHAMAREHGLDGWVALTQAIDHLKASTRSAGAQALAHYETMAEALLEAYRTGTPAAMARHYGFTWHRRPWQTMRTYVQLDLGKRPGNAGGDVAIDPDDARHLIAIEHGFRSWDDLQAFTRSPVAAARIPAKPIRLVDRESADRSRLIAHTRDWDAIGPLLAKHPSAVLDAEGQMTDEVLADLSAIGTITGLSLAGSKALTDEGARHLARLPGLRHLDVSGTAITDRGLAVLRSLPALETLSLAGTPITDEGAAHFTACPQLREINLSWTRTGNGALRALAGKQHLSHVATGHAVTDEGLRWLHELPRFKAWHGGEIALALVSSCSLPTRLSLNGPISNRGLQHVGGLEGLSGLGIDARAAITAAALEPLTLLPNLGWLSLDAKDDWMPHIAVMPALRFLDVQDTNAGDDGFMALSRSRSIEYIWGRRCHNLRQHGFVALADMPGLRGLSVSCLNVDDAGVSALPDFPALRELMPMDIPDAGYRHIGKCEHLESLILMYCRDTTDAATEHLVALQKLTTYFNSYTTITDRTPEILSGMDSLERITFAACHHLTNGGIAHLARLPRLRELRASGNGITPDLVRAFPPQVEVSVNQ